MEARHKPDMPSGRRWILAHRDTSYGVGNRSHDQLKNEINTA